MKWVKCSERLPRQNEKVLICGKERGKPLVEISYLNQENKWWKSCEPASCCGDYEDYFYEKELDEEVTHWMLLPEPAKDDK